MKIVEETFITTEIKAMVGVEIGPKEYKINRELISKFMDIIDDVKPQWINGVSPAKKKGSDIIVSPTFLISLFRLGQDEWARIVNCPLKGTIVGGASIENYQSVRVGETIKVSGKLLEVSERDGRAGKLVFLIFERNYKNQKQELVTKIQQTFIRI